MSKYKLYEQNTSTLKAGNFNYAILAARFNAFIVDKLLEGALEALEQAGAGDNNITVARFPGAFELPLACQKFAKLGNYHALIALGCVIRGDTPHFDYVCNESAHGLSVVALKYDIPVINGILTTDDVLQAEARATNGNNKGADAAKAAMEVLNIYAEL